MCAALSKPPLTLLRSSSLTPCKPAWPRARPSLRSSRRNSRTLQKASPKISPQPQKRPRASPRSSNSSKPTLTRSSSSVCTRGTPNMSSTASQSVSATSQAATLATLHPAGSGPKTRRACSVLHRRATWSIQLPSLRPQALIHSLASKVLQSPPCLATGSALHPWSSWEECEPIARVCCPRSKRFRTRPSASTRKSL